DTLALVRTAQEHNSPLRIIETVVDVNAQRKKAMADRIISACGGSVSGKTIGILGLAFKPNTDDMRDAPSLDIVPALIAAGATVKAYDPEAMTEAKKLLEDIIYCDTAFDTLEGADAMVVLTEWNEFRGMDLDRIKSALKHPIVVDLRNVYDPGEMAEQGFSYSCIGRASIGG
ncbi:UDP binding domain-containing protein, partial [Thalassospira xiamenensis]